MCVQAHPLCKCPSSKMLLKKKNGIFCGELGVALIVLVTTWCNIVNLPKGTECVKTSTTHCYIVKSTISKASTSFNCESSGSNNGARIVDIMKVLCNCIEVENPANHVNLDDQLIINSSSSLVTQDNKLKVRLYKLYRVFIKS